MLVDMTIHDDQIMKQCYDFLCLISSHAKNFLVMPSQHSLKKLLNIMTAMFETLIFAQLLQDIFMLWVMKNNILINLNHCIMQHMIKCRDNNTSLPYDILIT